MNSNWNGREEEEGDIRKNEEMVKRIHERGFVLGRENVD